MSGYHVRDFETFPVHKLKRVDRPTTKIIDELVSRPDEREGGFNKAARGEYGERVQKERTRPYPKEPISGSLIQMTARLREAVDGLMAAQKASIPEDPATLSRHIKEMAYFLRADAVGICELPAYAVYSHSAPNGDPVDLKHKYAIALLIDQDWRTAQATSGHDWIGNAMSFIGYSTSAFIACILAEYIRKLGYPARAHHVFNYQVVVPPILLWAGLGEMSRIGDIVVHPFLGPRFKTAIVTTDLPLVPNKPIDFGLQDFCDKCKKCARECPSQSLSTGGKVMHNGYERWPTDVRSCTTMRVANKHGSGCSTCITVCPWNKPYTPFHRAVGWTMRHSGLARSLAIRGDDLMGYGKPHPESKWWFDLEDAHGDGVLTAPGEK